MKGITRFISGAACGAAVLALAACGGSEGVAGNEAGGSGSGVYSKPTRSVPYVSGHRGGSAYAPEDTMTSYRNGARIGIDDFETDSYLSADGVLVLIHDATLDRTTAAARSPS